jgi:prephenate dehydrogenase
MINQITIIGVGLIGGSFSKGLKEKDFSGKVVGYGRNQQKLERAVELSIIDCFETDIKHAVQEADLILVAVPMGAFIDVFKQIKPYLKPKAIVTDAGSSKVSVIKDAQEGLKNHFPYFVPAHPIAGKEQSGVEACDGSLYVNHKVILTPSSETDIESIKQVRTLWERLGANLIEMQADEHDDVLAASSHLPHLLAFAIVDLLANHQDVPKVFDFTAGGFKDFSRIASSDPIMWRDITTANSTAIIKWLKGYQAELSKIIDLVENNKKDELFTLFSDAKQTRDQKVLGKNKDE